MVKELSDISNELNWKSKIIDVNKSEKCYKGIIIRPHEKSETLSFIFNPKGSLINPAILMFDDFSQKYVYYVSIKTQFAPIEIHIAVIKLLKYLKNVFIKNLEVLDEGGYWETLDERILENKMRFLASKIELLGEIFEAQHEELSQTKNTNELIGKVENILRRLGFEGSN